MAVLILEKNATFLHNSTFSSFDSQKKSWHEKKSFSIVKVLPQKCNNYWPVSIDDAENVDLK